MYTKKAGRLYDVSRSGTKEKCIVKLKRRHVKLRSDDSHSSRHAETDYKLTPFTTIIVNSLPSSQNVSRKQAELMMLTINELQQEINNQEMLRSLRFVCPNEAEAENWSQSIQYNVVSLVQAIFENKLSKHGKPESPTLSQHNNDDDIGAGDGVFGSDGLAIHKPIQREIVWAILNDGDGTSRRKVIYCGYLIRRNHGQQRSFHHQQVYCKPSIVFGVLYSSGEIEFQHSHEMNRVADVIACRVDLVREMVKVVEVEGSKVIFALSIGDETRELFVTSDTEQRDSWIRHLREFCKNKEHESSEKVNNNNKTQQQQEQIHNHVQEHDNQQDTNSSKKDQKEEMDPEIARLLGLDTGDDDEGGGTVYMKTANDGFDIGLGSDDDGDGSVIVHKDRKVIVEEPNIFGNKKRGNIFQNDFWSVPAGNGAKAARPSALPQNKESREPFLQHASSEHSAEEQIRKLQDVLADRESEIKLLKETLQDCMGKLEATYSENKRLKEVLAKEASDIHYIG